MAQPTVNVSGISNFTTEAELHDFFSFCGKIESIDIKGDEGAPKNATITFEKHSAAHTALMLNGGRIGESKITVTSEVVHADHRDVEESHPHIGQHDKPRAGIAAEYLAKGYGLSDDILQRAIDIDNKHGISKRFLSFMSGLDYSVGQRALGPQQTVSGKVQSTLKDAHTNVKSVDEKKGYSKTANEYYTKALTSPFGKSVLSFYTSTSKQVLDIHEEALRIKAHSTAPTATGPPAPTPVSPPSEQPPPSK